MLIKLFLSISEYFAAKIKSKIEIWNDRNYVRMEFIMIYWAYIFQIAWLQVVRVRGERTHSEETKVSPIFSHNLISTDMMKANVQ